VPLAAAAEEAYSISSSSRNAVLVKVSFRIKNVVPLATYMPLADKSYGSSSSSGVSVRAHLNIRVHLHIKHVVPLTA
jgi:hypothetical protein